MGDREFCSTLTFDAQQPGTYGLVVEGAPAEDGAWPEGAFELSLACMGDPSPVPTPR